MRLLIFLFRALLFLALFAFAINNMQPVTVNWFFSYAWTAPLVIVVLLAFTGGAVFGVLAMTPSWWHQRRRARRLEAPHAAPVAPLPAAAATPDMTAVRDGL